MKKILSLVCFSILMASCKTMLTTTETTYTPMVKARIDLTTNTNDKVMVTLETTPSKQETITFNMPKIIPGTYSIANYGQNIEKIKAFSKNGKPLPIAKISENTYLIKKAHQLTKITYWVNDTFDNEKEGGISSNDIFSPAGTNIDPNCYIINHHGFIGYFSDKKNASYTLTVKHPENLLGTTALTDLDSSSTIDLFKVDKYTTLIDHPILYAKPDYTEFKVEDMNILVSLYSPNKKYTVKDIAPQLETIIKAQKKFLGNINNTKKYAILIYLTDVLKNDAKGYGALEHNTSTTVVMPEIMPLTELNEQLKDIVSHEFFHIVTPLGIHSEEIHNFDFESPKMSKHLWMYEGVTEYFANLFQIQQNLISENDFYNRMLSKIKEANTMNDTMPFTKMSQNVYKAPYKDQYLNVYQKGALIGMCIDILIRENSLGEKGLLELMKKLNEQYGSNKPFKDEELFDIIANIGYPEVSTFLKKHVDGNTPIPYDDFFAKMGVEKVPTKTPTNVFVKNETSFININPSTNEILVAQNIELPEFYTQLGLKSGDIILTINNVKYNTNNIYDLITESEKWKENETISIVIKRNQKEIQLKGLVKLPYEQNFEYKAVSNIKENLRHKWLRN